MEQNQKASGIAYPAQESRRFLDLLIHDLRAPFRIAHQLNEIAAEDFNEGDLSQIGELLGTQNRVLRRADRLMAAVDVYCKLDAPTEFSPLSLARAALSAKSRIDECAGDREVTIDIGDLPEVVGHYPHLVLVFENLIRNALLYNESPVPAVSVKTAPGDDWTIIVEDNGVGIPEDRLTQIFEPLTRLWGPDRYEGAGLGLAICHEIMTRHGGDIRCTSTEGVGSRFWVRFPSAPKE